MKLTILAILSLTCACNSQTFNLKRVADYNSAYDVSTSISMELHAPPNGDMLFTISNYGYGSVSRIYFETGDTFDGVLMLQSNDVVFEASKPKKPPGGLKEFDTSFMFQAVDPKPKNGILDGDTLSFLLCGDVAEAQNMRVALHVIGLPDGRSDVYVGSIPEPACLGAVGFLRLLRRRRD